MMNLHPANNHNLITYKNTVDALLKGSTSVQKGLHVVAACGMFRNLLFAKPMWYIYFESSTVRLKNFKPPATPLQSRPVQIYYF
jgi:hypothetical protein